MVKRLLSGATARLFRPALITGLPASERHGLGLPAVTGQRPSTGTIGVACVPIRLPLASGDPSGAAVRVVSVLSPIRLCEAVSVPPPNSISGAVPLSVFCRESNCSTSRSLSRR